MINKVNKLQILKENFNSVESTTFHDYVESISDQDPNFFRWLFDESFEDDFNANLSIEQQLEFDTFLSSL